jgi:hypothetical protein
VPQLMRCLHRSSVCAVRSCCNARVFSWHTLTVRACRPDCVRSCC